MTIDHSHRTDPSSRPDTAENGIARPHTGRHDFVLVTQDLPGRHTAVADALRPVVAARRGGWVGCLPARRRWTHRDDFPVRPVPLTPEEAGAHVVGRYGAAVVDAHNGRADPLRSDDVRADAYRNINDRIAAAAADVAAVGGVVLIVGHQVQLVPAMLRRRRPDLLIAFYLELPFPAGEVFRRVPLRHELVDGILGADLVAFQTDRSADDFRRTAIDHHGVRLGRGGVDVGGRAVGVGVFPLSVDAAAIRALTTRTDHHRRLRALRAGLGQPDRILLAVDDLRAEAGIEQRLAAFGALLDSGDIDSGRTTLIQVVRPDPLRTAASRKLHDRIEQMVGLINDRAGRPAVNCLHRTIGQAELVTLYSAADVLWATSPLAETSLSAKEYIAARADSSGAVILSEFCAAAQELPGAYVANPSDVDDLRRAVLRAVASASGESRRRMGAMRRHVHTHDIHHWAGGLLVALGQSATVRSAVEGSSR